MAITLEHIKQCSNLLEAIKLLIMDQIHLHDQSVRFAEVIVALHYK